MMTVPKSTSTYGSGPTRRRSIDLFDLPLVRTLARTALNLSPRPLQTWLRSKRLERRRAQGFGLVPERELTSVYRQAVQWLMAQQGGKLAGDYLEFGVFYGSSLSCMHHVLHEFRQSHVRLFGFDSWQGLPERAQTDDHGLWAPGDFKMDYDTARQFLDQQGVDWERVHLIKGWFSDTLTPALRQEFDLIRASIIMVDCDLYSSAKEALDFCVPLIGSHAVILFDDWYAGDLAEQNLGEKRAWQEILASHPDLRCEETDTYVRTAKVLRVWRVQERRGSAPEKRMAVQA